MNDQLRSELEAALDSSREEDLVMTIGQSIQDRYSQPDRDYHTLRSLEQLVLHINWLDAEVANGGFHQLLTNWAGRYSPEMLETLETIGAAATARLLRRALSVFPGGIPPIEQVERQRALEAAGESANKLLLELDQEYYRQAESVFVLGGRYLRAHKEELLSDV